MKVDILCFGAHPDDVEIGMAATIAKLANQGLKIVICDCTSADLSTNGNVDLRQQEARKAGEILGITERITLDMKDRELLLTSEKINQVATVIRQFQPKVIFSPYQADRHPDHGNCTKIVREAVFSAGIHKYQTNPNLPAHKVNNHFYFMINGFQQPDFCVDVTEFYHLKKSCLLAYQSQFIGTGTTLTDGYLEAVEGREQLFGKEVNVQYAEGFLVSKPLLLTGDFL